MFGQSRCLNECLSTVVTFEGPFAGVCAMVGFEIRVIGGLLTIIALDLSILQVDRSLVWNRDELINQFQADKTTLALFLFAAIFSLKSANLVRGQQVDWQLALRYTRQI